jgi:hypothetical protein
MRAMRKVGLLSILFVVALLAVVVIANAQTGKNLRKTQERFELVKMGGWEWRKFLEPRLFGERLADHD